MLKLEAVLGETKGFAVGEQPSVADAKIFIFVTEYFDDKDAARRVPAAAPPPLFALFAHPVCSRVSLGNSNSTSGSLHVVLVT